MTKFIPLPTDVPESLVARQQWVVWRFERGTKVPYSAKTAKDKTRRASTTDPDTWSTFAEAAVYLAKNERFFDGLGYVFSADDPFVGVDLDHCIGADGDPEPWARDIIKRLSSYAEISPSGEGVKLWIEGTVESGLGKTKIGGAHAEAGVEVYAAGRYFTVTANPLIGAPETINANQAALDWLCSRIRKERERKAAPVAPATPATTEKPSRNDSPAPESLNGTTTAERMESYTTAALQGILGDLAQATKGRRNIDLNAAAFRLGKFVQRGMLERDAAESVLVQAGTALQLPTREVQATVRSGLNGGARKAKDMTLPDFTSKTGPALQGLPDAERSRVTIFEDTTPEGSDGANVSDWRAKIRNLAELQGQQFEPRPWFVAELLTKGATIAAGKAKAKKSWLLLGVSLSIARGTKALDYYDTIQGDVLYLDLEADDQQIQERVRTQLAPAETWPANFHYATEWPIGDLGLARIELWLQDHPDAVLVVVDVFANIRPPMQRGANVYDEDRRIAQLLHKLGLKYNVAIVAIHHTTKAKADDVFQEISGSMGLQGGFGTMWLLSPVVDADNPGAPTTKAVLAVKGRALTNEEPIALEWSTYDVQWKRVGNAGEYSLSETRREVVHAMEQGEEYTPKDLAASLGKTAKAIQKILDTLVAVNAVVKTGHGKYARILPPSGFDQQEQGQERRMRFNNSPPRKAVVATPDPRKLEQTTIEEVQGEIGETGETGETSEIGETPKTLDGVSIPADVIPRDRIYVDKTREALERSDVASARVYVESIFDETLRADVAKIVDMYN